VLDHLVDAGASHVAVLTLGTFESFTEDCIEEYRAWCGQRGAEPVLHAAPVHSTAGPHAFHEAAQGFLDRPNRPDAVFCLYERLAVEVLRAARERVVRVPDDLLVASINEMGLAETTQPSLTELEINQDVLGAAAAGLLVDHLEGGDAVSMRDIATRLIVRASSSRVRSG
jgi:DNA-binding LacI/PurR family transcriptional regulator